MCIHVCQTFYLPWCINWTGKPRFEPMTPWAGAWSFVPEPPLLSVLFLYISSPGTEHSLYVTPRNYYKNAGYNRFQWTVLQSELLLLLHLVRLGFFLMTDVCGVFSGHNYLDSTYTNIVTLMRVAFCTTFFWRQPARHSWGSSQIDCRSVLALQDQPL